MNLETNEIRVLFLVHVPSKDPIAECVALTGSHKAMGKWNSDYAVLAEYIGAATWRVSLYLPSDETIQWKWLLLSREAKEVLKWEEGPNRELSTLDDDLSVESFWNGKEMITALYSEGRRRARKMERRAMEQSALWIASEGGDSNISKKDKITNAWNRNNSYHSLYSLDTDQSKTRKSRSVSHLKVRFADETSPGNNEPRQKRTLRDCLKFTKQSLVNALYPCQPCPVDRTKSAVTNWKKIADYGVPVALVTGAATLGVIMYRKFL